MINIISKYILKKNKITFKELIENIDEINIVYSIIKQVKKSLLYDKLEEYINLYSNLNNYILYINEQVSEEFMEEFKYSINWKYISIYQYIPNNLIDKYSNLIDWYYISKLQDISEENILKYKDKIYFEELFKNKYIIKKYGIMLCNGNKIDFYGYESDYYKDIKRFYTKETMIDYFLNKIENVTN